jgi:hypothetical protein
MEGRSAPRDDLRNATLLLIESASSLGTAVGCLRVAVTHLHDVVTGDPGAKARMDRDLLNTLVALEGAWEGLEAANEVLGATDE